MRKKARLLSSLVFLASLLSGCGGGSPAAPASAAPASSTRASGDLLASNDGIPKEFIRRQGSGLVVGTGDRPIRLRGVNFANDIWSAPPLPSTTHHDETDYGRVAAMHMNVVRFAMAYTLFEDDARPYSYKQTGWDWLDQNIAWVFVRGRRLGPVILRV